MGLGGFGFKMPWLWNIGMQLKLGEMALDKVACLEINLKKKIVDFGDPARPPPAKEHAFMLWQDLRDHIIGIH